MAVEASKKNSLEKGINDEHFDDELVEVELGQIRVQSPFKLFWIHFYALVM